jgi:hypothetical protein
MTFKVRKIFEYQDMPPDVRQAWRDHHNDAMIHTYNGSYLGWCIHDEVFEDPTGEWARRKLTIDAWLVSQGANAPLNDDEEGEEVVVCYSW